MARHPQQDSSDRPEARERIAEVPPAPPMTPHVSPSRTPAELAGPTPEENRPNPQAEALKGGRDPPNKHDDTGGCPGGSPGREMADKNPTGNQGACQPSPTGAGEFPPGAFEQPARGEPGLRQHGDYAP